MSVFEPLIIASATLIIQILLFVLLTYGYFLKQKLMFARHGATMTTTLMVHAVSIFLIMVPSLAILFSPGFVLPEPVAYIYVGIIGHAIFGAVAFVLGLWLVLAWRFRKDISGCFSRKRIMIAAFVLWAIAIFFGVFLFGVFYGSAMFG